MQPTTPSLDQYFAGYGESREIFDCLRAIIEAMGPVEMRVMESQIAFYRNRAFALASVPGKYRPGRGNSLVLTLSLRRRDLSPRWKVVVPLTRDRFTHHLELCSENEIDDQVCQWLQEAWIQAA
jgi:hypothetical protein